MHLHQDPILAMEEEEEEIKPSTVGEKMEREALMVRGSLREEGSFILVNFHGHGRPWSLGGAAARGVGEEESVREWRNEWGVKRNESQGEEVAGQASFIEGGWLAASSLIWLVGRLPI